MGTYQLHTFGGEQSLSDSFAALPRRSRKLINETVKYKRVEIYTEIIIILLLMFFFK